MLYRILFICALVWCAGCQTDVNPEVVKRTQKLKVVDRGQLIESPFGQEVMHLKDTSHYLIGEEYLRVSDRAARRIYISSPQQGGLPWQKQPDSVDLIFKTTSGRSLRFESSKDRVVVVFQHDNQDETNDVNIYVRGNDPINPWKLEAHFETPYYITDEMAFFDRHLYAPRYDRDANKSYYDVYRRQGSQWQLDSSIERSLGPLGKPIALGDGFYASVEQSVDRTETFLVVHMRKADGWEEHQRLTVDDRRFRYPKVSVLDGRIVLNSSLGLRFYEQDAQANWRYASTLETTAQDARRWVQDREDHLMAFVENERDLVFYQLGNDGVWAKTHELKDALPRYFSSRESKFFKLHEGALYVYQPRIDEASLLRFTPNSQGAFDQTSLNVQSLAWIGTESFAEAIAMGDDMLFVGDPRAIDANGKDRGVVHLYKKTLDQGLTRWVLQQSLEPPDEDSNFGSALTYHNNKLLVQAEKAYYGRYYLYEYTNQQWSLTHQWKSTSEMEFTGLNVMSDYHIVVKGDSRNTLYVFSRDALSDPWPSTPYVLDVSTLGANCSGCAMSIHKHQLTVRVEDAQNVPDSNQTIVLKYDPDDKVWVNAFRLNESKFTGAQYLDDQHYICLGVRSNQRFIYIYDVHGEEPWQLLQTLTFTNIDAASYSFSVRGDIMVVWAYGADSFEQEAAGQAIIYERTLDPIEPWKRRYILTPNQPVELGAFSYPSATNGRDIAAVMHGDRRSMFRKVSVSGALFLKGASVATQGAMNETLTVDLPITSDSTEDITCKVVSKPSHGVLEQVDGLRWRFVPETYYAGKDSALYTCQQGEHVTGPWRLDVEIEDNLMPVAKPDTLTIEGDTLKGILIGTDPEGEPVTFRLAGDGPSNGTVTIDEQSGAFVYTQTTSVTQDTFTYEVFDGVRPSTPATITINRPATPQATPTANDSQCAKTPARPSSPWGVLMILVVGLVVRLRKRLDKRHLAYLGLVGDEATQ